jgi:hypothetical protein
MRFVALANMFSWVIEKRNSSRNKVIFLISHLSNLEFLEVFLKTKHSSLYTPQMTLSNHSMVYQSLPRHSVLPSFVFPTSKKVYVELLGRGKQYSILVLHML